MKRATLSKNGNLFRTRGTRLAVLGPEGLSGGHRGRGARPRGTGGVPGQRRARMPGRIRDSSRAFFGPALGRGARPRGTGGVPGQIRGSGRAFFGPALGRGDEPRGHEVGAAERADNPGGDCLLSHPGNHSRLRGSGQSSGRFGPGGPVWRTSWPRGSSPRDRRDAGTAEGENAGKDSRQRPSLLRPCLGPRGSSPRDRRDAGTAEDENAGTDSRQRPGPLRPSGPVGAAVFAL